MSTEQKSHVWMKEALESAIPEAKVTMEFPAIKNGGWWLDAVVDNHHLVVEYKPLQGFGISTLRGTENYGEGPDEIYVDAWSTLLYMIFLLKTKRHTVRPPEPGENLNEDSK